MRAVKSADAKVDDSVPHSRAIVGWDRDVRGNLP
jgi:hypothetical protein